MKAIDKCCVYLVETFFFFKKWYFLYKVRIRNCEIKLQNSFDSFGTGIPHSLYTCEISVLNPPRGILQFYTAVMGSFYNVLHHFSANIGMENSTTG